MHLLIASPINTRIHTHTLSNSNHTVFSSSPSYPRLTPHVTGAPSRADQRQRRIQCAAEPSTSPTARDGVPLRETRAGRGEHGGHRAGVGMKGRNERGGMKREK